VQEITLDEFEQWAIDRLKVLGEIDSCMVRNKSFKDMEVSLKPLLQKYLPLSFGDSKSKSAVAEQERKKDHYSHFILRLAFCRNPELRNKFVRLETTLFKLRFITDEASDRRGFVDSLNFDWEPVNEDERQQLSKKITTATPGIPADEGFFKVPFEKVTDLVESRRVLLVQGNAYVPQSYQTSMVTAEFTAHLEREMEMTARALPRLDEDLRIIPILNHLGMGFTYSNYDGPEYDQEGFTADSVDRLEKEGHFPLCMKTMHRRLRADGHAKHVARMQYGLFLKGIGLSVDESLKFWRQAFRSQTDDQFRKNYAYNIRHSYGLEGGRRDYKPMGCMEVTKSGTPGPGESHGCPYRYFTPDNLANALRDMGISDKAHLNEVRNMCDSKHYHLACTRVYELTHPKDVTIYKESISHPNTYFSRSWEANKKVPTAESSAK
jgi:DNA primase large subunit